MRLSLAFMALVLASCSGSKNETRDFSNTNSPTATNLSYEFVELNFNGTNKCTTEKRTFNSLIDLCISLTQRADNRSCALDMRKKYFSELECAGEFEETNFEMSTERLIPTRSGICHIKYVGPNPVSKKADFCSQLIELFRQFMCGETDLAKDYIDADCGNDFPL